MHGCFSVNLRAEEVAKFIEIDLSVTISVNPTNNSKDLSVNQSSSH